jgi:predicted nuclease of predicted toxin-antitoxin system
VRWLADENFHNAVVRGLLLRSPHFDIVRAQDVGLGGQTDEVVLDWATRERRVLLTHDVRTITDHFYRRVLAGKPSPGVFEAPCGGSLGRLIEDLLLIDECSQQEEWEGKLSYLPFRRSST